MKAKAWNVLVVVGLLCCGGLSACGGGGGSNNGNSNNGTTLPVEPLETTKFLYIHYPNAGDGVGHVYVYDTTTKQSSLVTDLDKTTKAPQISLSPDRKWFAMRAVFRPNETDLKQGISIPSLWVVSVDGKQFKRVTEPILNSNLQGAACTIDSQCPSTGHCNTSLGKCGLRNYSIGLGTPRWSNDGKTLWTNMSTYWSEGTRITGGSVLASVPVSGGVLDLHNGSSGCQQVTHVTVHPKEDKLIANHTVCTSGKEGLHEYAIPPKDGTQLFANPNLSAALGTLLYVPNGSGVIFLANTAWDLDNDQKPDTQGIGVAGYDFKEKTFGALLPPLKQGLAYQDMTMSPDSSKLVVCIYDSNANTNNLYQLDFKAQKDAFQPLIEDGKSCNPTW